MRLPFKQNKVVTVVVLVLLIAIIPLTLFMLQRQQELRQRATGEQASLFFTTTKGTTPLVTVATDAGQPLSLNLVLDVGANSVNGFDVTITTTGNLTFSQLIEGPDAARFPTSVFNDISNLGHTLRFTKVNSNTQNPVSGSLLLATITFAPVVNAGSGTIQVPKAVVTSPLTVASLTIAKPTVSYTVIAPTNQTFPVSCTDTSSFSDTMLVIDRSSSMKGTKLDQAKLAAKSFVDAISVNTQNKVGLVSFATDAKVNSPISSNYPSVKSAIDALSVGNATCIACGLTSANQEIVAHGTAGNKKVVVLLTDGRADVPGTEQQAEQAAQTAVQSGHSQNATVFYTIGLGADVNDVFLKQMATDTGGKYYFSPTTDQLVSIYGEISKVVNKGSATGFVFNDANDSHAFDIGEEKLSGWKITLSGGDLSSPLSFITNSTGAYSIPGICASQNPYVVTEEQQPGWTQTVPVSPASYSVTVNNGETFTDKNFGNVFTPGPIGNVPTETPIPTTFTNPPPPPPGTTGTPLPFPTFASGHTGLSVTVILTGIGVDLPNYPGNKNPSHPQKNVRAEVFDQNNNKVTEGSAVVNFDPNSGRFKGVVDAGLLQSGVYNVKLTVPYYLRRLIPSIQTITTKTVNQLSEATLVVGDINGDNVLNILDYNIYQSCFGNKQSSITSSGVNCIAADLNDDGELDSKLNLSDYKLLFASFATQKGD